MGVCSCSSKAYLSILCLVLWAIGAFLMFIGIYSLTALSELSDITAKNYISVPAGILIGVGVLLLILGVMGCYGAWKESRVFLGSFFFVMLIIFLGYVVAAALGIAYRKDVEDKFREEFKDAMNEYGNNTKVTEGIDWLQDHVECCGFNNYTDWDGTPYYRKEHALPVTCCRTNRSCNATIDDVDPNDIFTDGCYTKGKDFITHHLAIVVTVALALAILLLISLVAACVLFCRNQDPPYINLESSDGLRV